MGASIWNHRNIDFKQVEHDFDAHNVYSDNNFRRYKVGHAQAQAFEKFFRTLGFGVEPEGISEMGWSYMVHTRRSRTKTAIILIALLLLAYCIAYPFLP